MTNYAPLQTVKTHMKRRIINLLLLLYEVFTPCTYQVKIELQSMFE